LRLLIDGGSLEVALPPAPATVSLGSYSFEVGPNCYGCSLTPSLHALIDISVDGLTRQLDLPYSWSSSGPNDMLSRQPGTGAVRLRRHGEGGGRGRETSASW
jgi:hypothetical protein